MNANGSEAPLLVLSIDAWRDGSSWTWNQWFKVGTISKADFEALDNNRKILRWFRDNGFTSESSVGRASVDDDGYNVTVCDRSSGMPLFAIEYGPHY